MLLQIGIFLLSLLIITLFLYYFGKYLKRKNRKKLLNARKKFNESIQKAELDFDESFLRTTENIVSPIKNFFTLDFLNYYIETQIKNGKIKNPSVLVVFASKDKKLTLSQAKEVGSIIRTEFNGNIITACKKEQNQFIFYVFLQNMDKNECEIFILTAINFIEKKTGKKFNYSIQKVKTLLNEDEE